MILQPAVLHKTEILKKFALATMDNKYKYFWGCGYKKCVEIYDDECNSIQYAIIKNKEVIGIVFLMLSGTEIL